MDRYAPASFSDIGTFQGRNDVLGIGISSAQGLNNRPSGQQVPFYNTQGMQQATSGGVGSVLSADLYIPSEWGNAANGNVRTDMWGVMGDGAGVSDYTIAGFTNHGGDRYRVWDDIDWVDLSTPVNYDAWTTFSVEFTGTSYIYRVNGVQAYEDTTINGSTGFTATIMQAYNFCGDTSLQGAVCKNYTAHWSNTEEGSKVPTPASFPLALLALGVLGSVTIRQRRAADHLAKMA